MVDPVSLLAFLPAALLLNVTPGADMLFCLGQGARGGAGAAWAASAGVALGGFVHALAAGLGLAGLMAAAPWSFDLIRWIGVGYLLWLALGALRSSGRAEVQPLAQGRAFRDGLIVNLGNPKVILFMLAFVPHFIQPGAGPVLFQFLIFGGTLALGGLVVNGCAGQFLAHAAAAGGFRGRKWLDRIVAALFTGLAIRLMFLERL